MLRALWFLIVLALLTAAAVWLVDRPGQIQADWQGYRIETSVAVLIVSVALVAAVAALAYRFWLFLRRSPGRISDVWRLRQRRRGYEALTRGMVAVAAGDGGEAKKQAKRAEGLLNDPPLTMLLSAQAAQLAGDERAAETFFKAMVERPETEFLGLRGLLNQALARGDRAEALALARRAYRVQPSSEWVAGMLFDLQVAAGQWRDATVTGDDLVRRRLVDRRGGERRRGLLAYMLSADARHGGDPDEEMAQLRRANDLAPGLVPATARLAERLAADGKTRRALGLIEKAWKVAPHPDLLAAYRLARPEETVLDAYKSVERLAGHNPGHAESRLALAEAAIAADLWGEARRHLAPLTDGEDGYRGRACRLMARVEEAETGDAQKVQEWLLAASLADPDRTWVCGSCGNAVTEWSALCGNCGAFDGFTWRTPLHVSQVAGPDGAAAPGGGRPALPAVVAPPADSETD